MLRAALIAARICPACKTSNEMGRWTLQRTDELPSRWGHQRYEMVLFHAERHTTESNFEFETTATFEARSYSATRAGPRERTCLGHARTHTPAQTQSIYKHDRSARARAHMLWSRGLGRLAAAARDQSTEPKRASALDVVCCPSLVTAWHVSYRARGVAIAVWGHRWPAAPTSATSRKSKASASLDFPFQAMHTRARTPMQACTYAHAHAGKCDLDFLVCVCYCDDGFCCSVCVVPSTHRWPPHSH